MTTKVRLWCRPSVSRRNKRGLEGNAFESRVSL